MARRILKWLPLLPLIACVVFIAMYATATPLTDEWLFLRGAMRFSHAHTFAEMCDSVVWGIYNHVVVVPFVLVYLPVGWASGYDARALVAVTLLCHASILYALVRRYSPPPFILFCAAVVLFSPARFVELLWGFEFTLAVSIAFPVWALYVCDRMRIEHGAGALTARLGLALLLLALGALSAGGGYIGFPAAMIVIAIKNLKLGTRIAAILILAVTGYLMYQGLQHHANPFTFGRREIFVVASAAGAALVSSPIAMFEFLLDWRAFVGGTFVLISLATVARAGALRMFDELAFAIGLVAYGLLAVLAIAVNREYLANWHIQHILPAMAGTLVLCYLVWQKRRATIDRRLCFGACAAALLGLYGWYKGFNEGGPEFSAYVHQIERYIVTYDANPNQPKPFPPTESWDIDHDMIEFLRSKNHPLFR